MKKVFGFSIPFFLSHLFCCGALLFFLTTSGYLLLLKQESDKRIFLIPLLIIGGIVLWIYKYYGKCCKNKGSKTISDHFIISFLFFLLSFIASIIFMIYVFIPWWIPNYKGGPLLP